MRKFKFLVLLSTVCLVYGLNAGNAQMETAFAKDDFCGTRNIAFGNGEILNFTVYYSLFGIYVNAGNATVKTQLKKLNNRPVYHIVGDGKSNTSYSWIARVNNRYETYVDTASMQPLKFIRDVHENNHKRYENISFNRSTNTAITREGVYKVPSCVQDVVSSLYYARNINFDKYKIGDKISFDMFLDNEVYSMYLRYMGKEEIKTRYGKFRTIKLKPLLLKGNTFDEGEKMTVWITDDKNRIPVRAESPIKVGSVKVDMMGYKNLRHPLTSLTKVR